MEVLASERTEEAEPLERSPRPLTEEAPDVAMRARHGCDGYSMDRRVEQSWDEEYQTGRYQGEPPVGFTQDILVAAEDAGLSDGLYIGCGNGRNYIPLVEAGLDLIGLDVSGAAIEQLAQRLPDRCDRLVHGDLSALPEDKYQIVVGIQVFQHGDRIEAQTHLRSAQERVEPGGLFCLRVNALGTHVTFRHEVKERHEDESFTVRYLEGPKDGLDVHFFSRSELDGIFGECFDEVVPLRIDETWRSPRTDGQWSQWEGIWRRRS